PLTATIQNTRKFSQALADNSEGIDKFLGSISQLSDTIHNLSGRLDSTLASVQHLVQAVDPQKVDDILSNTDRATKQLADASATVQKTLDAFRQTAETYRAVGQKAQKTLDRVDALMAAVDPKKVGSTVDDVAAASAAARQTLGQIAQVTAEFDKHADDIDKTLTNIRQMSDKLNAASSRVDEVLAKVSGFLGDSKASSVIADAKATLKSYRQLADNLNSHIGPIAANFQQFSNNGLKDVVALINQMRQAVAQIQDSVSTFQQNPQRLIFGGPDVKQYNGDRTRR
ncbi:MAG TPA: MCE family protein, partial [Pararhizobium sp.]|nr:MCE family protein [Pararhizobium sp.]